MKIQTVLCVLIVLAASRSDAARPCSAAHLSAGGGRARALRHDGLVACWGEEALAPYSQRPPGSFVQVSVGPDGRACGVRAGGDAECWTWGGVERHRRHDGEDCDDGDQSFVRGDWCSAECTRVRCGVPTNRDSTMPTATDALFVLQAAVELVRCDARVCDVDHSDALTAGDALRILRKAVGVAVRLSCPPSGLPSIART